MDVHIDISDKYEKTTVIVQAKEWSEDLKALVKTIKRTQPTRLLGTEQEQSILLQPQEIDFVYAEKRKVFAAVKKKRIELKLKLYEVETLLEPHHFTRFSKSVVGNLNNVERFELAFNGNLCVHFSRETEEYVSRKYVTRMKDGPSDI